MISPGWQQVRVSEGAPKDLAKSILSAFAIAIPVIAP